jgi:hypothetical protein
MTTATVLVGRERRRRWTTAEKLGMVEESFEPGVTVAESRVGTRFTLTNCMAGAKMCGWEAYRSWLARKPALRRLRSRASTRPRLRQQRW